MTMPGRAASRMERLFDAIDMIESGRRQQALPLLRSLIQENSNDENAWLWMSVAVENIDQSVVCLDNVLRINPKNSVAAAALYNLRKREIASEQAREKLRARRNLAFTGLWMLIFVLMFAIFVTSTVVMVGMPL